jgi:uncharacterized protein (TIGR02001 family)
MLKTILSTAALVLTFSAYGAEGQETLDFTISPNITATSNYLFRGISQTDNKPAIQGGLDISHKSGLYVGTWLSNVDFGSSDNANVELDLYAGYNAKFLDDKGTLNLQFISYQYPNSPSDKYNEIGGSLGYDFGVASTNAGVMYSWDYFNGSGNAWYPNITLSIPVYEGYTLNSNYGYQYIEKNYRFGTSSYNTYGVSVSKEFKDIATIELGYQNTSLNHQDDCFGGSDACRNHFFARISRKF